MYTTEDLARILGLKESSIRNNLYPEIKKTFPFWDKVEKRAKKAEGKE
jgi:hypothetical protein